MHKIFKKVILKHKFITGLNIIFSIAAAVSIGYASKKLTILLDVVGKNVEDPLKVSLHNALYIFVLFMIALTLIMFGKLINAKYLYKTSNTMSNLQQKYYKYINIK